MLRNAVQTVIIQRLHRLSLIHFFSKFLLDGNLLFLSGQGKLWVSFPQNLQAFVKLSSTFLIRVSGESRWRKVTWLIATLKTF